MPSVHWMEEKYTESRGVYRLSIQMEGRFGASELQAAGSNDT